uniref:Uncharacterized protein n=1 Tax=Glossina austeni TaxID=7395 RepID=A0A1A9V4H9_GLOAU
MVYIYQFVRPLVVIMTIMDGSLALDILSGIESEEHITVTFEVSNASMREFVANIAEFPEPTADTGDVCEEGEETVRPTLLPMLRLLPLTAAPPTSRLGSNRRSFAATDDVEAVY